MFLHSSRMRTTPDPVERTSWIKGTSWEQKKEFCGSVLWCGLLIIKPFYSGKMNIHCHGHTHQWGHPTWWQGYALLWGNALKAGDTQAALQNSQGNSSGTSQREKAARFVCSNCFPLQHPLTSWTRPAQWTLVFYRWPVPFFCFHTVFYWLSLIFTIL